MKKAKVMILVGLMVMISFTGCTTSPPRPPAFDIPKLVLDYDINPDSENKTIFYVHGVNDVKYNNITLFFDNETVFSKKNSYSLEYKTNRTDFFFEIDVIRYNDRYNFNATLKSSTEKDIIYEIIYYDGDTEKIKLGDLPLNERLDKVED